MFKVISLKDMNRIDTIKKWKANLYIKNNLYVHHLE